MPIRIRPTNMLQQPTPACRYRHDHSISSDIARSRQAGAPLARRSMAGGVKAMAQQVSRQLGMQTVLVPIMYESGNLRRPFGVEMLYRRNPGTKQPIFSATRTIPMNPIVMIKGLDFADARLVAYRASDLVVHYSDTSCGGGIGRIHEALRGRKRRALQCIGVNRRHSVRTQLGGFEHNEVINRRERARPQGQRRDHRPPLAGIAKRGHARSGDVRAVCSKRPDTCGMAVQAPPAKQPHCNMSSGVRVLATTWLSARAFPTPA